MRAILAAVGAVAMAGCGQMLEREARDGLAEALFDPNSAVFRELRTGGGLLCGKVNAKNRLGGYVGFRPFIIERDTGKAYIDSGPLEIRSDADLAAAYEGVIVTARTVQCDHGD